MLVWRVEHPVSKVGPFQHHGACLWGGVNRESWNYEFNEYRENPEYDAYHPYNHPGPRDEGLCPTDCIHGFSSLPQAQQWFRPWHIPPMMEHGYRLHLLDVYEDYVQVGASQVCFLRYAASLVEDFPVCKLMQ